MRLFGSEFSVAHVATFGLLYASYIFAYLCKRNYAFWLSGIIDRGEMTAVEASVFGSTMELAYGAGKLVAGPIADTSPPVRLLVVTLGIAAVSNALMFASGFYVLDIAAWACNGFSQAFIWPALALVFFNWFGTSKARGTLYSLLSTNQNLGSAITPILLAPMVNSFGWRAALWGPAFVTGVGCVVLALFLKTSPADAEEPAKKTAEAGKSSAMASGTSSFAEDVKRMLQSPQIWILATGYLFLTFCRTCVNDWTIVALKSFRDVSRDDASQCLILLELGGFIGGLAAGAVSDSLFKGRRGPVMAIFSGLISAPAVCSIFFAPLLMPSAFPFHRMLLLASYFFYGFGAFGPHVLVGLVAREIYPTAPSTAGSFAKSIAQIGGSLAGVPVSLLATSTLGWAAVGYALVGASMLTSVCFGMLQQQQPASKEALKKDL